MQRAILEEKAGKARSVHQLRQAFNASRAYRRARVDWLAHIDVDEFLICDRPLKQALADVPGDAAFVRMRPAEMLAQPDPWRGDTHFKLTSGEAGTPKSQLDQIYPDFGSYVPQGFISYNCGKNFARTGISGIRLGIHTLLHKGASVENGTVLPDLHVGHAHAPSWDTFRRHFDFRMAQGSYRKDPNASMKLRDVLEFVVAENGEDGLRHFFSRMCEASPDLLQRLHAHNMLLTAQLNLDDKVARWFGELPPETRKPGTG